jgi:hypothetical protein
MKTYNLYMCEYCIIPAILWLHKVDMEFRETKPQTGLIVVWRLRSACLPLTMCLSPRAPSRRSLRPPKRVHIASNHDHTTELTKDLAK